MILVRPPSSVGTSTLPPSAAVHERHRRAAIEIVAVALEDRVLRHRDEDVEIARRPAIEAGLAFARKADARAFLDARRDVDGERALLLHMAGAAAGLQGFRTMRPLPWHCGQVRSMVKKPWVARTLPWPAQVGHCSAAGAGFRAGAAADFAGDRGTAP